MSGFTKLINPVPFRWVGKKHFEQGVQWVPALATFGGTASFIVLYLTEWKAVLKYFPFYNGKFKETPES